MYYVMPAGLGETAQDVSLSFLAVTLVLLGIGSAICVFTLRGTRRRATSLKSLEPVQTAT
jgi:hypothetical protein